MEGIQDIHRKHDWEASPAWAGANPVKSAHEAVQLFRKIINWSKKNTQTGEQFGDCLSRVGFE